MRTVQALFIESSAPAIAGAFVFGLLLGSFLNVVILRLPRRLEWQWKRDSRELLALPESNATSAPPGIVVERSACPHCGHPLAAWENIPLLSYALLRGRCRDCKARISPQYPLVELLTGLLCAACAWRFGLGWELAGALAFTGLLVALAGIDLRTTLLPDQLTYPLLWLGLLASTALLPLNGNGVEPMSAIVGAVTGYLGLWSVYWAFKLLTGKEGMGHGDFKLLAALGTWCGLKAILPILLLSSLMGAIVGGLWLVLRGRDRATPIPFGPFLAAAGWLQFVWGGDLLGAYLHWAGL